MKATIIAIVSLVVFFGGLMLLSGRSLGGGGLIQNVSVVDGKQIVVVTAKGGYSPRVSNAKADTPTILRMETRGTFDCSSALAVPAVGFRNYLPASGLTDIEIPPQKSGTSIRGVCAMGMYSFAVNFN